MMNFAPEEFGLVLIATGQAWPNYLSALYYKGIGGLTKIIVYETAGMEGRGQSLIDLLDREGINEIVGGIDVVLQTASNLPKDFETFISGLANEEPDKWVLNATGGLKLFSFLIPDVIGESWVKAVIYRELTETCWYEVVRNPISDKVEDVSSALTQALLESEEKAMGDIPDLIKMQMGKPGLTVSCDNAGAFNLPNWPDCDKLETFVDNLIANDFNDGAAYDATFCVGPPDGGKPLELLMYLAAWCLGFRRVAAGIRLVQGGKNLCELDVVSVHQGKLIVFECKANDNPQWSQWIQDLANDVRLFGGLAAKGILVTPRCSCPSEQRAYAELLRVQIWDMEHMVPTKDAPGLFGKLVALSNSQDCDTQELAKRLDAEVARSATPWGNVLVPTPIWDARDAIDKHIKRFRDEGAPWSIDVNFLDEQWTIVGVENPPTHVLGSATNPYAYVVPRKKGITTPRGIQKRIEGRLPWGYIAPWGCRLSFSGLKDGAAIPDGFEVNGLGTTLTATKAVLKDQFGKWRPKDDGLADVLSHLLEEIAESP